MDIGKKIAVSPITKRIFAMLLPKTFPTAISTFFLNAAATEEASSGADVPKAIISAPITTSGIPRISAREIAWVTKNFADKTIANAPKRTRVRGLIEFRLNVALVFVFL